MLGAGGGSWCISAPVKAAPPRHGRCEERAKSFAVVISSFECCILSESCCAKERVCLGCKSLKTMRAVFYKTTSGTRGPRIVKTRDPAGFNITYLNREA